MNLTRLVLVAMQVGVSAGMTYAAYPLFVFLRGRLNPILGIGFVDPSADDLQAIAITMAVCAAVVLGFKSLFSKGTFFDNGSRFVNELYALILAANLGMLYVFIGSDIIFAPSFFLAYFILTGATYVTLYIIGLLFRKPVEQPAGERSVNFLPSAFRSLISPAHLLTLAVSAIPGVLCVLYKVDDRAAAQINYVRAFLQTPTSQEWVMVDMFPGEEFEQPISVDQPKGANDFYVLERPGRIIRLAGKGDGYEREVMLDFRQQVREFDVEKGALGFALHPDFRYGATENAYVYIYYTAPVEGKKQANRLSRFNLGLATAEERLESETILVEQRRPGHGYHNAGDVVFGPDGMLYFSVGEAMYAKGWQNLKEGFYGGIFRIDVNNAGKNHEIVNQPNDGFAENYRIPDDNPFAGQDGVIEEYFALGLRNPFRFSFDQLTGKVWVSENGEATWEEINQIGAGANCQYPDFEGPDKLNRKYEAPPEPIGSATEPYYAYKHTATERSVIGGAVYRAQKFQDLYGAYLYADGGSGRFYRINVDAGPEETAKPEILALIPYQNQAGASSVSVTRQGEVLVTVLGVHSLANGRVLKLARKTDNQELPAVEVGPVLANTSEHAFFKKNCATCHGNEGKGDGMRAKDLKKKPRDLTQSVWQDKVTDQHIYTVIEKGGAAAGISNEMPGWMLMLEPNEIQKMVNYVRSLRSDGASSNGAGD